VVLNTEFEDTEVKKTDKMKHVKNPNG